MNDHDFISGVYYNYLNYKESALKSKRIRHTDITPLLGKLNKDLFQIKCLGQSTENRDINLISFGKGKKKIFMWSQMHGDEPTATMGIFDLLNFLGAYDYYNELRRKISENVTLYFLPMLNPDGAEVFDRRNSDSIDLNRDVVNPQTPEARILKDIMNELKADFAFNLHDQSPKYTAGETYKSAVISFLAPAPHYDKRTTKSREEAMRLISLLTLIINHYIPGHIAKYKDDFEPRAFGDYCQSLGTSTILIESGWWLGDPEKQFVRKMNFLLLASAIKSIAEGTYKKLTTEIYDQLPFNEELLYDIILRRVHIQKLSGNLTIDIALTKNDNGDYVIEDIGDLSKFYGHSEHNLDGYEPEITGDEIKIGSKPKFIVKRGEKVYFTIP